MAAKPGRKLLLVLKILHLRPYDRLDLSSPLQPQSCQLPGTHWQTLQSFPALDPFESLDGNWSSQGSFGISAWTFGWPVLQAMQTCD